VDDHAGGVAVAPVRDDARLEGEKERILVVELDGRVHVVVRGRIAARSDREIALLSRARTSKMATQRSTMPAPETLRELRRGQIVAVAQKIVADEGLEALTIGSLEARLAFSRGVITYHFQNKDDIVHAVLESAIEEINAGIDAQLGANLSAEEKLRTLLKMYVRGFLEHVE